MAAIADLPYQAEYAKSGRAACRTCKEKIDAKELRIAVMVKSSHFDGKMPFWHHEKCFFLKQKPKSLGDIAHFDSLRWEDQETIRKKIESGGSAGGKPGAGNSKSKSNEAVKEFTIEYAKSAGSTCIACDVKIGKKQMRIGKKDYESESALMYGPMNRWHHVDCFVKVREGLQFYEDGSKIPGFKDLDKDDKVVIKSKLPAIALSKRKHEENGNQKTKKIKTETVVKDETAEIIKMQNQKIFAFRDRLSSEGTFRLVDLKELLTYNKQQLPNPAGQEQVLDQLSDIMAFGALKPCTLCKTGQLEFRSGIGYQCRGYLTEYTKCGNIVEHPERKVFKVPSRFKADFEEDTFTIDTRLFPVHKVTSGAASSSFVKLNPKPLANLKILLVGDVIETEMKEIISKIEAFGGSVPKRATFGDGVAFVICLSPVEGFSTAEKRKWAKCEQHRIPAVGKEFLNRLDETMVLSKEIKSTLYPLGAGSVEAVEHANVDERLKRLIPDSEKKAETTHSARRGIEKPSEGKIKLKMKDGAVVDPESCLEETAHVYREGSRYYTAVLNKTDVDLGTNSYYKVQLIEADSKKFYWVFRAWGRLGTTIGGTKLNGPLLLHEALDLFNNLFTKQTGNIFGHKFNKAPGAYLPMDLDYGDVNTISKLVPSKTESKLHLAIQELVCLLFDVENMKSAMLEFELDLDKMPLGKLSRDQVLKAYGILSEALDLLKIDSPMPARERLLADASNRFYTMIPHNFGTSTPTILNNEDILKAKLEMLENLMDIELAYELLQDDVDGEGNSSKSLIDKHFDKLNARMKVLEDVKSSEYEIISTYLNNTHAKTHDNYTLEIEQVFKLKRSGEKERFKSSDNRMLLWHGSRTTNYVGILSQGLRIAPPEAPATGYMFGKGIYFADMVSKSANYCFTSPDKSTGLLLLCEVALGKMYELTKAKEGLREAPPGFQSVKGLGQTCPDPKVGCTFSNGTVVPLGPAIDSKVAKSELLYNEYIVYDPAQVQIRFLLKVKFVYKNKRSRR